MTPQEIAALIMDPDTRFDHVWMIPDEELRQLLQAARDGAEIDALLREFKEQHPGNGWAVTRSTEDL